jgi:hypothetical protein
MAADAILFELGVRQLAARIPFEDMGSVTLSENLEICRREAAKVNRFYTKSRIF